MVRDYLAMSERWLIVVNGKTELNYVTALRQRFRSSNIEVKHVEKDPLGQVLEARTLMRRGKYARIYVVFDTDNFAYDKAISMIHDLTNEKSTCTWHVVVSRPCFELWVLLHSIYTNAEFAGNTPCNDLRARFSKEFAKHHEK